MPMPSNLELARKAKLQPMVKVAARMGIGPELLEQHGDTVAKIRLEAIEALASRPRAKYVVVSAITPTPLGEGKTTTTVGLGQAFAHLGKTATIAIRQPSMGPTFGIKGGAAGGGYSQVVPMELLNLHLTGDFHAVTAAHNLLAAVVDNHLYQGNELGIDPHNVTWRRVMDVNDRALRNIVVGLGGKQDGVPRQTGFDITAASEVMAILALASSVKDLEARLARIVVGYTRAGSPVTAKELQASGAMAVILREAVKPNLLQTLENTPVLVHAGPFGNIATGNSSVLADLIGIHGGDYLVTEAGFGADMGAERFFNIKCRVSGLRPDAAVVVATVRALKAHSGRFKMVAGRPLPEELLAESPDDVHAGGANLRKQIENVALHGVPAVVAINAFPGDHPSEWRAIEELAAACGVRAVVSQHFAAAAPGRWSWPRRWPRPRAAPPTSGSSTRTTPPCGRRSRRSPPRSTAPTASTTPRPRPPSSTPTSGTATASCRSASPRPTCRSRRTRRCWARRPAGGCRCARRGRRSGPGSST